MPPSVHLREKPPLIPSSWGKSALRFYIYSLLLLPGRAGISLPWYLRPSVRAHTVCRSTPTALTHSQLSSQPHTGACTRTSSWYLLSWCLCLFLLSSPFPLRYLRPWVLSCCFPTAALLSFNLCQQGRVPVWWCLIPWEPQRLRVGHEGLSQQMAVCRGDELGCWCLIFLLGFVFPSPPLGGSSESASAGRCHTSPWLGSAPGPH